MMFYIIRLLAGYVVIQSPLSIWLLSFSVFLFFSLGLLKRCVEIILLRENNVETVSGRGYSIDDNNILMSIGVCSGLVASLVLLLYIGSDNIAVLYNRPIILISLVPIYMYWVSWTWFMAIRKKIKLDPVTFTIKNKSTYFLILCCLIIIVLAGIK